MGNIQHLFFVSAESLGVLENCASGISDLLQRQIAKHSDNSHKVQYSPALRSFALTLHFYSPRAYRYVRKMFDTCLPHPRTIAKWYHQVEGKLGFTNYSFSALKSKVDAAQKQGKSVLCSLIMDEIAIRQQIDWDGKKYHGYIDMGTELDNDKLPLAKEALVFMVNSINDSWKLPVGYCLIAGLGAQERANLLRQCLDMLHSVGVTIVSLTFDGSATNISMIKEFGCYLDYVDMRNSFPHPATQEPVAIFLDPCHMRKLVRNAFGDKKHFIDEDGNHIDWKYIEKLHELQVSEGLHLGNKLRFEHIAWIKKKMNVRLAAQLLSESVAKSLQFCLNNKIFGFKGCEATIKFLILFNNLFDILILASLVVLSP